LGIVEELLEPAKMVRRGDASKGVGLCGVLRVEYFASAKGVASAVRRVVLSGCSGKESRRGSKSKEKMRKEEREEQEIGTSVTTTSASWNSPGIST
jgi:hypothetical protein